MKNSLVRFFFLQKKGSQLSLQDVQCIPGSMGFFRYVLLLKWQGKNLFIHKCQVGEQVFLTQLNKSSWVNRYCLSMLAWINIVNCQISYTTGYHFKHTDIIYVQIVTSTYFQHVKCMTKPVINCSNCSALAIKIRHQWRRRGVKAQYPKNPRQILADAIHESNDKNSERNPASDWVFFSLDFISEINKCQEDLKGHKNNLLLKVIFHLEFFSRHKTTNFKIAKQTQGPQCLDMFLIYPFSWENIFHKGFMG